MRATGAPSPTWEISDAARAEGARGLLYRSRSRPDLTHVVLFDLIGALVPDGPPLPWTPPAPP
ncbi:RES family NAD+ phosphorylase [Histidinibacterium aquaticum]|uniref:RES family NAD+ phosphorylase n=1 Tax=Histidinibacterium aquaticum TaxID=2613962 RepID=UPI0021DF6231|nr:RES family NAD+ phosphorylase [Histidinibacterium aquaticum]